MTATRQSANTHLKNARTYAKIEEAEVKYPCGQCALRGTLPAGIKTVRGISFMDKKQAALKRQSAEALFLKYERTDGRNVDFIENCRLLDLDLDRRVGEKIEREKYKTFNGLDQIKEAIVVYECGKAIGGGAIRRYDDVTAELKRVFVHTEYQGRGIGSRLVSLLVEWAVELGYERMLLETGELLAESCAVYRKLGFEVIENYGPYADMPESLCMAKNLKSR